MSTGEFNDVNHPERYADGNVECINAMREILGDRTTASFCLGNVFKYLWRRKLKEPEKSIQKALWYFDEFKNIVNSTDLADEINESIRERDPM